jgi:hypothetical protein
MGIAQTFIQSFRGKKENCSYLNNVECFSRGSGRPKIKNGITAYSLVCLFSAKKPVNQIA